MSHERTLIYYTLFMIALVAVTAVVVAFIA